MNFEPSYESKWSLKKQEIIAEQELYFRFNHKLRAKCRFTKRTNQATQSKLASL